MALFMTARQVAERWNCSTRHVQRLCASGELQAMRLGEEAWRVSVAAVEAYELAHTSQPAADAPSSASKPKEAPRAPVAIDGFTLPADYEPVFPELWGKEAPTKKAASVRR